MNTATKASLRTVKGRPQLFTSYAREMSIFNTRVKRNWVIVGIIAMAIIPFFASTNARAANAFPAESLFFESRSRTSLSHAASDTSTGSLSRQ